MVTGTVQGRGAVLAYDELGSGRPLVLVHGTGADAPTWGRTVTDLAQAYRVIAYDRRGYGRSTHDPVRDYRVHASDLGAVLRMPGSRRTSSVGARGVTPRWPSRSKAPELVRSLVVVEAPFHGLRHATRSMLSGLAAAKVAQLRGRPEQGAAAFARWASGLRGGGNRKVRYRGIEKNNAWLHTRTAALNLRRLLKLGLVRQDGTWVLA